MMRSKARASRSSLRPPSAASPLTSAAQVPPAYWSSSHAALLRPRLGPQRRSLSLSPCPRPHPRPPAPAQEAADPSGAPIAPTLTTPLTRSPNVTRTPRAPLGLVRATLTYIHTLTPIPTPPQLWFGLAYGIMPLKQCWVDDCLHAQRIVPTTKRSPSRSSSLSPSPETLTQPHPQPQPDSVTRRFLGHAGTPHRSLAAGAAQVAAASRRPCSRTTSSSLMATPSSVASGAQCCAPPARSCAPICHPSTTVARAARRASSLSMQRRARAARAPGYSSARARGACTSRRSNGSSSVCWSNACSHWAR